MVLDSLDDTGRLAEQLVASLAEGSLLLLAGPLGAGKTTLVQHIARVAGSTAAVTSPTYTLIHEVPTPMGLLTHIDAYRLPDVSALFDLGLDDYLDRSWLTVVEWGAALRDHLPRAHLIELDVHPDGRRTANLVPPTVGAPHTSLS